MWVNSTPVTPGADDAQVRGDLGRRIRLTGGEDALAVERRPVRAPGARPGGDHEDVAGDLARPRHRRPRSCASPRSGPHPARGARPATPAARARIAAAAPRSRGPAGGARPGRARRSPRGPSWRPGSSPVSAPPVAIIAFDGMQSQRCAAPPTTSRSTSVTSAPERRGDRRRSVPTRPAADDHEPSGHAGHARSSCRAPVRCGRLERNGRDAVSRGLGAPAGARRRAARTCPSTATTRSTTGA